MRITGLGHAGLFIQTRGGSLLCDPVIGPSFFGSWFPFPDNRALDWERFGDADYLFISHRLADHLDPALLRRFVRPDIPVLLPEYPTDDLERDLRSLGYDNVVRTRAGVPFDLHGTAAMITPLRAPSVGPIGDASLSIDDGTASLLAHSDAHPLDLDRVRAFSHPDAYFLQVSGTSCWPMVYDLPHEAKVNFAHLKREAQDKRALYGIDAVAPSHVFPFGGPPMFLRPELFGYNGWGSHDEAVFTDQAQFLALMRRELPHQRGHLFLPGTVVELTGTRADVTQTLYSDEQIDRVFGDKWNYLAQQRDTRQGEIAADDRSRGPVLPAARMLAALQEWWEPLLRRAEIIRAGVGGSVRFCIGDLDMVVDFPAARVRDYAGEECMYRYTIGADLVSAAIAERDVDWSNSVFRSLRFEVDRRCAFNEFLGTFLTCLSAERIDHAERWYAQQAAATAEADLSGARTGAHVP